MIKHKSKDKQKELEDFVASYDFNEDNVVHLIGLGIRQNQESIFPIQSAFRGGNYLGCPGKDIYFAIQAGADVEILARYLSNVFPKVPPVDHVAIAACLRYIYGCFDKQGALLSKDHEKIVSDNNWKTSLPFITTLEKHFHELGNKYGLLISYEMKGHRYGDDVIAGDKEALDDMLHCYNASQSLAKSAGSLKHMFTPFYWAACYLERCNTVEAKKYHWKNLKMMEKHCPDTREGYQSKAKHSWNYIMSESTEDENVKLIGWQKSCSNKCIKKIRVK